ncbi:substrate-binding periplasmic protein [Agarivorans sp. MS3-6]|uniref:substrate-binding periplasmic protein n=1 Tax=Agarivorans sp. TSD2052 TaxID=2937286 RepID=UPI00200E0908|nr:transporter substrate-binding domain-containing protein [Agarivorans sp. TSD2052]UPW17076.1 transporter substrate-binding domain-containing protein [Agarivorans sp. TSD2052]
MRWSLLLKRILFASLLAISFSFSASAELSICNRLVVTGNAEYPPILWRDQHNPGKLTGLAIELLELALMDTGIEVDARDRGVWARALQEAEHGEVDMLAGAFLTDQRQTYMDYIVPQFTDVPSVVWTTAGHEFDYQKWEDLLERRGGTLVNNSFGQAFDAYAKDNLKILTSATAERSFAMLLADRFDYVLYELYQGLTILESAGLKGKVTPLPKPISVEGLYFTFSKQSGCNSESLRRHLSERVSQLTEFKTFERLFEKHMQAWSKQQINHGVLTDD